MRTNRILRFVRGRDGAALVEFSLIAPLLVALMCGMVEFTNVMRQYHVMEKGVRDAARYVARVQMNGCTLPAGAITAAQNLALTGRTSGGTNLLSTWTNPATVSVTVSTCFDNASSDYRGRTLMPVIQVQATAPYADLGFLSVIGLGPINLQVTHQQLWIGA